MSALPAESLPGSGSQSPSRSGTSAGRRCSHCWRLEAFEAGRKLRLAAEMKIPGPAWWVFEVAEDAGGSIFRQTAIFDPMGLWGLTYRYLVCPLHQLVFTGMLRGIARAADHHAGVP